MADQPQGRAASREFCYTIAPGEDYYHRLLDGEIYLFKADEKALPRPAPSTPGPPLRCTSPKLLREPVAGVNVVIDAMLDEGFEILPGDGGSPG